MKTIMHRGWAVTQSCVVSCGRCGSSNVDHSCGTPAEAVKRARLDGWRMVDGVIVCDDCMWLSNHGLKAQEPTT